MRAFCPSKLPGCCLMMQKVLCVREYPGELEKRALRSSEVVACSCLLSLAGEQCWTVAAELPVPGRVM